MTKGLFSLKIISLSNMTMSEAYNLDKMLSYCAEMAFQEARSDDHANDCDIDISDKGINVLASSYMESLFASDDDEHVERVKKRLRIELNRWIPSSDPTRQELLIPIMAYALLVSNEYNAESVRKRINVDNKREKPRKGVEYPYNRWKHIDPYSITRSDTPPKSDAFRRKLDAIRYAIKVEKDYAYCDNMYVIFANILLHNYENIAKCQDLGRIGLFLRQILLDTHCQSKPINTLLRLYLANHLDNSLFRYYALCDNAQYTESEKDIPFSPILTHYHNGAENSKCRSLIKSEMPAIIQPPEKYRGWQFSEIYKDIISSYSIKIDDIELLLDFYLDEDCLRSYGNIVDDIKNFADCVIKNIAKHIEIPENTLTGAMDDFAFNRLHTQRGYRKVSANRKMSGKWRGETINRRLCISHLHILKRQDHNNTL